VINILSHYVLGKLQLPERLDALLSLASSKSEEDGEESRIELSARVQQLKLALTEVLEFSRVAQGVLENQTHR
jgi:hypothetical protein